MTQEQLFEAYEKVKSALPHHTLVFQFIVKIGGLFFYSEAIYEDKLLAQLETFEQEGTEILGMEYAVDYGWDYEWRDPSDS